MKYTPQEVIQYIQEEDVKFIRLAFCDVQGRHKNISIMPSELERAFKYGIAVDASAIDGFGDVMAHSVADFFAMPSSRDLVDQLTALGVNMQCRTVREDDRFAGMTFVLTGTLPTMKRDEASALVEK